ncbi:MAG: leucine-rich repeat domain-containing protein [Synergistaceae bacterium]|nr:leucine-rich repeat domain-containing protein [Synergistaceae bacterium]
MNKRLSILILVILAFTLPQMLSGLAEENSATENIESGDYLYNILPDNSAMITNYYGNTGEFEDWGTPSSPVSELTLPAILDGYPVSTIGYMVFYEDEYLTKVIIPEGVTIIEDEAFCDCPKLSSISLPDSLLEIRNNPFSGCLALTEIIVSHDHPVFGVYDGALYSKSDMRLVCFYKVGKSKEFHVPRGTLIIGDEAFRGNEQLRKVEIPDTITRIGSGAFEYCVKLENIAIPDSVTEIGNNPFIGCSQLKLSVSKNHPTLGLKDGILFSMPDRRLVYCPDSFKATEYAVPEGTEIIGAYALGECSIERIILPDGVKQIREGAFASVNGLVSVVVPASVETIEEGAFYDFFGGGDCCVTVEPGSYAESYCRQHEMKYVYPEQ